MAGHEDERVSIRLATPEDATGISECFRVAYDGTYPIARISDARLLRAALADRAIVFAIAAREDDGIVGASALVPPAAGPSGDICHGAVLPAYRKLDLFRELQVPLFDFARARGLHVLFGRCVTVHPFSQRCMERLGLRPVGLTLATAPTDLTFTGIREELAQRESFLDVALPLAGHAKALTVSASPRYHDVVRLVCEGLGINATFVQHSGRGASHLRLTVRRDDDLGTVTVQVGHDGNRTARDLVALIADLSMRAEPAAIYVELPVTHASTTRLIDELRGAGFSFAAFLPERASDGVSVIRMQRPLVPVEPDPITIAFSLGSEIKSFVFDDLRSLAPLVETGGIHGESR